MSALYAPVYRIEDNGSRTKYSSSWTRILNNVKQTVSQKRPKPADLFANGTVAQAYREDITCKTGYMKVDRDVYYGPMSFAYGIPSPDVLIKSFEWGIVDGKLRSKIKQSSANLLQNLKEYRETAGSFTSVTSDVYKTFQSLRKGRAIHDFRRLLSQPRGKTETAIADRWLNYQYGLKPTLGDIHDSIETMNRNLDGTFQMVRASYDTVMVSKRWSGRSLIETNDMVTLFGACRYRVSNAALKRYSSFGITNPLALAWELIPYSFVVDWLFNVGDYLSQLDALVGVDDIVVCHYYRHIMVGSDQVGSVSFKRMVGRNSPTSGLGFQPFRLKPKTSLTPILNGLALLRQIRR